jgi:hypothetical protein
MKFYLVEYKNKFIGVYINFNLALRFILGNLQNGLMTDNATIKTYNINSCYCVDSQVVDNNYLENKDCKTNYESSNVLYLVEYKNVIIAVYDDNDLALDFVHGCIQNNLISANISIKKYYENSCYCIDTVTINSKPQDYTNVENQPDYILEHNSEKQNNQPVAYNVGIQVNDPIAHNVEKVEYSSVDDIEKKIIINLNNNEMKDMANKKIELQHNINLLKFHKNKIEESKIVYDNDIKLFNIFLENKQLDPNFEIPDIFTEKFNLMFKLNQEGKLSWNNFINEFQHKNLYNEYFDINSYEAKFNNEISESDISEEFNL